MYELNSSVKEKRHTVKNTAKEHLKNNNFLYIKRKETFVLVVLCCVLKENGFGYF